MLSYRSPKPLAVAALCGVTASLLNGLLGLLMKAWLGPVDLPGMLTPTGPWGWLWLSSQIVLLAPLAESIAFMFLARLLKGPLGPVWGAWMAGASLALVHSLQALRWGVQALPLFLISAWLYLAWRDRGMSSQFGGLVMIHLVHNLASLATLLKYAPR